jgi:putative tricarboxylic transport membrane protein
MVVAIGVFAIGEVLGSVEAGDEAKVLPVPRGIRNLLPNAEELKACRFAFLNGSITGFLVGCLPGGGATISSFIAYGIEKAVSKHPEQFGKGAPEGVAAPEGANNADTGGALVPLLTLGIPSGGSTAIMLSALVLWGVKPGPLMMQESPDVFWGLVASMYIGNVVLLILNLPLVPLFAQILRLPVYVLFPIIFGISIVGAYGASGRMFDLGLLVGFGLLGYAMSKLKYPSAPLILGFVLGDAMERALRQSLMMSQGDLLTLVERPISAIMLSLALVILLIPLFGWLNRLRVRAITENG